MTKFKWSWWWKWPFQTTAYRDWTTFEQNHEVSIFTITIHILTTFFILSVREIYHCVSTSFSCVKIRAAIIIHAKFRGVQKLMILRYFLILYVQILSDFKNWDIQDLRRKHETIKTCRWNFFKISWVVHYRKICKNQTC